ncbi:hypothetical protein AAFF_G00149770 [Aldrovandia affinis]|uniref:Gypsy retrotransposon integrase-like protein 1 n=1 Tax=Aldrovandia affinis TaxID=143900 RepID=A0AAD7RPL4_9TELE|nr:hypothetical protein AAFF_G00149770 [Aldrovandia affinis]
MSFTGDWSVYWDIFTAEYEDYVLVTGTAEKDKKIQAATLRSVMGSECRHVYRHNLNLSVAGMGDPAVILDELEKYFKPAKNTIYERYVFGSCKQEEGESIDNFVTRLRERAATCLVQFTIPGDVLKVEHAQPGALTKEQLINKYSDVFNSPVESVPGEVHFDLDPNVPAVQSAPRNVPIAMKAAVKAQLDKKRWLKLPFGVSVAPEVYQRKQHELLAGLKGIEPIADDILVVGCGDTDKEAESDHDAKLVALMGSCREVKLRLGLKKLQFKVAEVQFHGHILSSAGLKPDPEKIEKECLNIVYKPGHEMFISDTLSRATAGCAGRGTVYQRHAICSLQQEQEDVQHVNQADYLNVSSQRLEQIRRHTDRDECLQALKNTVLVGWPDVKEEAPLIAREYRPFRDAISVQNGVLFRGQKVIIPKSLRPEMLTRIHSSHIGGEACYRHAQETLYWPNMHTEIKDFVSTCSTCNVYAHNQQKETMLSHDLPTRPWQILSMDMFTHRQKDYLLIVNHYSDFWEIELLPDMSAETVINRCKAQFARHGQPERVITDNGPQFTSQFTRFASEWEFEHVTSSPRHPKANGKAESAVKIAKNLLRKAAHDGDDPLKAILHWRNTPTENMGSSPAQRLMSRRLKTSIPATNKLLEPVVVVGVTEKPRHRKQLAKSFYDRSARDLPELEVGETVRMKPLPGDNTGRWRVRTCLRRVAPRSYLVDVDGSLYRRNRVDLRVAEPTARATHKTDGPEAAHAPETAAEAPPTVTEPSPVRRALTLGLDGCLNHL